MQFQNDQPDKLCKYVQCENVVEINQQRKLTSCELKYSPVYHWMSDPYLLYQFPVNISDHSTMASKCGDIQFHPIARINVQLEVPTKLNESESATWDENFQPCNKKLQLHIYHSLPSMGLHRPTSNLYEFTMQWGFVQKMNLICTTHRDRNPPPHCHHVGSYWKSGKPRIVTP
jgi:hypothetical protein